MGCGEFWSRLFATGVLLSLSTTAYASESGEAAQCELHVFPIKDVGVTDQTQATVMGGILPELLKDAFRVKRPEEISKFLRDSVPIEKEIEELRKIEYQNYDKGKDAVVSIHDSPYIGFLKAEDPPVVSDIPSCYRELILWSLIYEKGTMHKAIRLVYSYRVFQNHQLSAKAKFRVVGVGIHNFPPDKPEEVDAARLAVSVVRTFGAICSVN